MTIDYTAINSQDTIYLSAKQTKIRYGSCSDMWLWRRRIDDSGFPEPHYFSGRRFWKLSDLMDWERKQSQAGGRGGPTNEPARRFGRN